jgi:hypothetical protein
MGRFWRCFFACWETKERNETHVEQAVSGCTPVNSSDQQQPQQDRRAQREQQAAQAAAHGPESSSP